jgi:hypothetical protein
MDDAPDLLGRLHERSLRNPARRRKVTMPL